MHYRSMDKLTPCVCTYKKNTIGTCKVVRLAANGRGIADEKRSVACMRIICERYRVEIRQVQGMFTRAKWLAVNGLWE